jgi:subtilisin family serine protease
MTNLLLSICVISSLLSYSQTNFVQNQIIVQLNNQSAKKILSDYNHVNFKLIKQLSFHNNICLFEFDHLITDINSFLININKHQDVFVAQKNHILTKRIIPNDLQYTNQWQYFQSNDMDIDADEAWDITTGGLTANGDTIVACIVDDGINSNHPDLAPNLWYNHNEIPNNNIDDDGNGYIDDYKGWNTYDLNNEIEHDISYYEGHGSPVAGIVGAKGNNGIGVAGVNWNIKLMIVKGGGQEADAIAAYSYALENRILYDQTNGQKGAYVVVTNSSWGIDYGRASQAPIWCAFYDTLGNYGILSAGATINNNENVDVVGDLPTECPSDYLVTVTNTTINDVKEIYAGYGATTIDLGAPGEGTWTVGNPSYGSSLYDSFGGTSGATPHVSGAIALLYSAPCSGFANLVALNPKLAAEKVKGYILNGVETNNTLLNKTVSGGRLNIKKSLDLLMNEFGCTPASIYETPNSYKRLVFFPNPIKNSEELIFQTNIFEKNKKLTLYSIDGKKIYETNLNSKKVKLPTNLNKGIYQIIITTSSNTYSDKIIIID